MDSPKNTQSGRRMPPQAQVGGIFSRETLAVWTLSPQSMHMSQAQVPWNSTTSVLPAAWCNPSTFWVMTVFTNPSFSSRANPLCPSLGAALSMAIFKSLSRVSQTSVGFSMKKSM